MKSILHGNPNIPIYTASISPNGLRCAGEVADGVFPMMMSPEKYGVVGSHIEEGFAKAGGGKSLADFAICPGVSVIISDDIEKARMPVKMNLALYIGGMGARDKNFYNDFAKRMGFEEAAAEIQDLFLSGKRAEAVAAVPTELVDAVHLVGPKEKLRDGLARWREAGEKGHVDTMMIGTSQPEALEFLAVTRLAEFFDIFVECSLFFLKLTQGVAPVIVECGIAGCPARPRHVLDVRDAVADQVVDTATP